MKNIHFFWFRRDLRLEDNAGLYRALKSGLPVQPVFIFDQHILERLEDRRDARLEFIHREVTRLDMELRALGSSMLVAFGYPADIWKNWAAQHPIHTVFTNHDYESYALQRDETVRNILSNASTGFQTFKDQVIFERQEVVKDDGLPYTVFTPYSRKWKERLHGKMTHDGSAGQVSFFLKAYPTERYFSHFLRQQTPPDASIPTLQAMKFQPSGISFPSKAVAQGLIRTYDQTRDFPAIEGTSRLGIHFRFGTISIREKARKALAINQIFLNELIWRDFYAMILQHFPQVETRAFRPEYDDIEWLNNEAEFQAWCDGKTGFPLVDAGMRELSTTGFMHNRVRMLTASFLTKHLLIDWRWGEAWFAQKLLDFDLASNNGGWQWAAGCGTDAAPYFRIFSPEAQLTKFDKDLKYVKKWVPEYGTADYVQPIIDHKFARERCLKAYQAALKNR